VRRAWLREIETFDDEGNAECTGEFECTLGERGEENAELLAFDEAVAWAREHADRAYADVEWERYVVVGDDPELPPVPPELAERLRRGPRRPVRDAWRDRSDDAPAMRWEIVYRPVLERVRAAVFGELEAAGARPPFEPAAADIEGRWRAVVDVFPPGYEWAPPLL
jgi:hypothetical protein